MAEGPEKDEKTEEATPKRLADAREKGQVPFSSEVMSASSLVAGLLAFAVVGPHLAATAGLEVAGGLHRVGELGAVELDLDAFAGLLRGTIEGILPALLMLVLPVVALAAIVGFAQVGGVRLAPKAIEPKPNKLDPIQGAKRMFGAKAWTRTGMALAKLIVTPALGPAAGGGGAGVGGDPEAEPAAHAAAQLRPGRQPAGVALLVLRQGAGRRRA